MENFILYLLLGILSIYFLFFYENHLNNENLNKGGFNKDEIYEFKNFLSDEECSYIIEKAKPLVTKSKVIGEKGLYVDDQSFRTSSNTFLKDDDEVIRKISDRISKKIMIDKENFEDLQVVHYEGGEQYKPHWDACVGEGKCDDFLKKGGDRYATFILYLNDDFESGETEFPNLNIKVKPEKGKAVLFFNLEDDNETKKEDSLHAGLPPTKGEKWMCNKWIRVGKFQ
jgi:prolyl 4-hydroxylase